MSKRILEFSWLVIVCAFVLILPLRVSAAVTISSFDAKWQSGKVVVNWKTASELSNVGFNILRSTSPNGTFAKVNYTPAQIGNIAGASYSFTDSAVTAGQTYYYRVQSVNASGGTETYSSTATAAAAATPTATTAATATRTRTRTPTVTATSVPGVPTGTTAPQFTPTRTATYPPGVTPPTATATSLRVAVAVAVPSATTARSGAANPPPSVGGGAGTPAATRIALAPQEPTPEDSAEEVENEEESTEQPQNAGAARGQWLIHGGVIVVGGLFGLGALGCGAIALILALRFSRREN